ncbi:S-layer homology domain-containing protein [Paenibacillus azoreducens]|uniref:S-layer homology domain-containing protein n=1 Tax=Paenibacillus azoreducens TaxID=116718 RepID=UPI0039F5D657
MLSQKWTRMLLAVPLTLSLFGQGVPAASASSDSSAQAQESPAASGTGRWMSGEFHVHTFQSDDAQTSLKDVLDHAFDKYGFDWIATANHLRSSKRDDKGNDIPGGPIPFSKGAMEYEVPEIKKLQEQGKYAGKTIFSGFEWDMPSHEHVSIGILGDEPNSEAMLKAANQFEYLFTNRDASWFDPADVAEWNQQDQRAYTTHADALTAISWLKNKFPQTSYMILNHPSRIVGKYTIADIRDLNNLAPDIVFGMEGMIGGQMEPDRGGYNTPYTSADPLLDPKAKNRSYGGTDYMVAKVGGVWDALLGEGRHFWNFANSDFHFKIRGPYSSGYWPGEYSRNYTWTEGSDMQSILNGLRSGKSFSVYGDLINELDFHAANGGAKADMGGDLQVTEGDDVELTIRFKSPETNHYESPVDSGISGHAVPQVDHVDLIAGDVTGKTEPRTPEYSKDTNDSTKVIATFTSKDWTMDSEGYNVIKYTVKSAEKNQYFRLRGTNLGMNVEGETKDGNPLLDPVTDEADNDTRFNAINDRNYKDLWFYSNPVFVTVAPNDQFAVEAAKNALDLGDLSSVTTDISLPTEGERGTSIQWTSSHPDVIANDGKLGTRPENNTLVTLTAEITRGSAKVTKTFLAVVAGMNPATVELHSAMFTADGKPYADGAWTNQSVTASVYADVHEPSTSVTLELSQDDGQTYEPYTANDPLVYEEEGERQLLFRATDETNVQTLLPLKIKIDKTPPVITLIGAETVTLTVGDQYKEQGAKVTDPVGVPGEVVITGEVNTSVSGQYTVLYNAKDAAGNAAAEVKRTVIVKEKDSGTPPAGGGSDAGGGAGNGGSGSVTPTPPTTASPSTPTPSPSVPESPKPLPSAQADVSAVHGSSGSIPDVVKWMIPAGAVQVDRQLNVAVVTDSGVPSTGTHKVIGPVVAFTSASGGTLAKPMDLTLHYDPKQLPPSQKPAVYYYNESRHAWVYLGGKVNPDGMITVETKHLAKYAVFGFEAAAFTDLTGHWGSPFVDRLAGMDVIRGYDDHLFHPEDQVTRVQFAVMLSKALGLAVEGDNLSFADRNQIPAWAKADVAALVKAGLISGYPGKEGPAFKPDQVITRAEMAVMLDKALLSAGVNAAVSASPAFRDASQIPAWAAASVQSLTAAGIIQGYGDQTFRAQGHVTRAEAASMLYKWLEAMNI